MKMNRPKSPSGWPAALLTGMVLGLSLPWAHTGDKLQDQLHDQLHNGAPLVSATSGAFRTPMVELYTSEGCSSCPPADNWLRRLGLALNADFNAVPLAFHVDYWNYLGWTDPYSKPAFTKRQREAPANRYRGGGVYTPEFVVDGREARGGDAILEFIRDANSQQAEATIRLSVARRDAGDDPVAGASNLEARIDVDHRAAADNARAHVAVYESGITRKIGAGENHGRTLMHDFVVRHWSRPIAIRRGANHADVEVEIPADWKRANLGLAVVVLDPDNGRTLQAVRTSLAPLFFN